ncbi:hypothetical protein TKK_0017780 [Trichogramma kaykai]
MALLIPGICTIDISDKLASIFTQVKEVNVLDSKDDTNLAVLNRPELGITFTKLHCWKLTQYEKCVFLDADVLVIKNSDELFERDELSAAPDVGWPDCFNSGVFVYAPSEARFADLVAFANSHGSFDGADQGLLNLYFHDWAHKDIAKHLPFIYNMCSVAMYSYAPAYRQYGENVKIVHFIGNTKPWLQHYDTATGIVQPPPGCAHLQPLIQTWWNIFCDNVHSQLSDNMADEFVTTDWRISNPSASPCSNHDPLKSHERFREDEFLNEPDFSEFKDPWENYCEPVKYQINPSNEAATSQEHDALDSLSCSSEKHSKIEKIDPNSAQCKFVTQSRIVNDDEAKDTQEHTINHGLNVVNRIINQYEHTCKTMISETKNDNVPSVSLTSGPLDNPLPTVDPFNVEKQTDSSSSSKVDNKTGGIAGALSKMTLEEVRTEEQSSVDEGMRKFNWEQGQIDYMGADSFDNIMKKIHQTIAAGEPSESTEKKTQKHEKSKESGQMEAAVEATNVTRPEIPEGNLSNPAQVVSIIDAERISLDQGALVQDFEPVKEKDSPNESERKVDTQIGSQENVAPATDALSSTSVVRVEQESAQSESQILVVCPRPQETEIINRSEITLNISDVGSIPIDLTTSRPAQVDSETTLDVEKRISDPTIESRLINACSIESSNLPTQADPDEAPIPPKRKAKNSKEAAGNTDPAT